MRDRTEQEQFAYSWGASERGYNARQVRILCEAVYFFLLCYVVFPLNFVKIFFAYGWRYPLEIWTGTGVTDHAESEYVIFIHRTPTLQNSSGVICLTWIDMKSTCRNVCRNESRISWNYSRNLEQFYQNETLLLKGQSFL